MIQGSVQILYHYLDKLTYVRITLGNPSEKYQEIAQFLTKTGGGGGVGQIRQLQNMLLTILGLGVDSSFPTLTLIHLPPSQTPSNSGCKLMLGYCFLYISNGQFY